ncbi:sigma-70 family RNA polymerase sigma factor [Rhizobium lusitanum]|uniref:RNA polymerase sigma factor n=1 Tax=Rhizobium lusitanum TaxID=293958 RepID=A0A6L9U8Y8_9HYPH|nr:sigma-70 family RNA polymerase sigma factor [Rhizobium lusitanum]NEI70988.1 sigma-70 family RNA polymerase sigma factor [Rhizobium lusitanum]
MRTSKQTFLTHEQEKTASSETLVRSHRPLVQHLAMKFSRYGVDVDDLIQEGNVGLIIAASKFEPDRGFRFSTYAHWWAQAKMRDLVIRMHSVVRPGTSHEAKAAFFKARPHHDVSIDTPVSEDGMTLQEQLESSEPQPDQIVEALLDGETAARSLRTALRRLNARELDIINSRFLKDESETLWEIGSRYGITNERVRQIEAAALKKLRNAMAR